MTRLQILQFLTSVAFGVIAMKHMWERLNECSEFPCHLSVGCYTATLPPGEIPKPPFQEAPFGSKCAGQTTMWVEVLTVLLCISDSMLYEHHD